MKLREFIAQGLAGLLLLMSAGLAWSATEKECLVGRWSGELKGQAVTLEFSDTSQVETLVGRYYVGTQRSDRYLWLKHPKQALGWSDSDSDLQRFSPVSLACSAQQLTLQWPAHQSERGATLTATRLPETVSYEQRRLAGLSPVVVQQAAFKGRPYSVVSIQGSPHIKAMQLPPTYSGAKAFNQDMKDGLLKTFATDRECAFLVRQHRPYGDSGSAYQSFKVSAWSANHLTLAWTSGESCGGDNPGESHLETSVLYDLRSGKVLDGKNWLMPSYTEAVKLDTPLGKHIVGRYRLEMKKEKRNAELCIGRGIEWSSGLPGRTGMVFDTRSLVRNGECDLEINIPYSSLHPYMSTTGKEGVTRLQRPN